MPTKPSTSIHIVRLKVGGHGPKTLAAAEEHGKREDASSQRRRVSDTKPLLHGGLNLQELYARHVEGCRMDGRMKSPVLHCIVQWPTDLPLNEKTEKAMLSHARKFMNELLGGEAVFAARLDRDEKGKHSVDVFCSPVVTKKDGRRWVQTQKHLKALTERHRAEIERRHPTIKDITGKRPQGMALQSEWRAYVETLGFKIPPKREKQYGASDWVTPEQYALDAQRRELAIREADLQRQATKLEQRVRDAEAVHAALTTGQETPAMTAERERDETAEHGMPYFEAYEINNGRPLTLLERIAHIVSYWRDRLTLRHDRGHDGPGW